VGARFFEPGFGRVGPSNSVRLLQRIDVESMHHKLKNLVSEPGPQ
jgi:hypothetical protein